MSSADPDCLNCSDFERHLAEAERRPFAADVLGPSLAGLSAHVRACAACRSRHGARLAAVEGFSALRGRAVPEGLLDGLGERVLARARLGGSLDGGADGGGMSAAFLDAPQSLALWRRTALAASVLLALGTGLLASGQIGWLDGARPPVGDGTVPIRDGSLEAWATHRTDDPVPDRVQTVGLPGRGLPDYWSRFAGSDHLWIHPVPAASSEPARAGEGREKPSETPPAGR